MGRAMKKKLLLVIVSLLTIAVVLAGPIMSNVEQAPYKVVRHEGNIEIRDYAPLVVAETEVTGPRKNAIKAGFKMIADYIFGNNSDASKISMTAPVMQQLSVVPEAKKSTKKIKKEEMVDKPLDAWGIWKVRFVMPAIHNVTTLPQPNNHAVKIETLTAKRFAVIRFAGLGENDALREQTAQLEAFLKKNHLKALSTPVYGFFNPPWTLSPLRRNEVMIEVAKK